MLTKPLEFELFYNHKDSVLELIDYKPPGGTKPAKLIFKNIKDLGAFTTALNAWIEVKQKSK